jgi:hypothetical protein
MQTRYRVRRIQFAADLALERSESEWRGYERGVRRVRRASIMKMRSLGMDDSMILGILSISQRELERLTTREKSNVSR